MPTAAEIDAQRTSAGGWTRETLAGWGVPWPPPRGWRARITEEEPVPDLFDASEYTAAQKATAIKREISQRRYVYPRRIQAGKMTQQQADFQIAVFESILADYEGKA